MLPDRPFPRARRGRRRPEQAGQYGRRGFLRHPAARRWAACRGRRRRRRQRQPGSAVDGAAARDDAYARGRAASAGRAGHPAEHPGVPAGARHALHHVVLLGVRLDDRESDLRERRPHDAAPAATRRHRANACRTAASRWASSRVRSTLPDTSPSSPANCCRSTATGSPKPKTPGERPLTRPDWNRRFERTSATACRRLARPSCAGSSNTRWTRASRTISRSCCCGGPRRPAWNQNVVNHEGLPLHRRAAVLVGAARRRQCPSRRPDRRRTTTWGRCCAESSRSRWPETRPSISTFSGERQPGRCRKFRAVRTCSGRHPRDGQGARARPVAGHAARQRLSAVGRRLR